MSDDKTLFEIGERIGGTYEIRTVLGEGGMGRVYGAHDPALNRRVAIKASWPWIEPTLLVKEAQAIASVRHLGMVDVYGAGTHRGIPFLAMEFLYGVNLETFLDKRVSESSRLGVTEVLDLLIPVADALVAVHRSGITHRDVKPANIMLTPNGRIVLMDFGLFTPESDKDSVLSGTPEYMAPESLLGEVDPRNAFLGDIYALGITAYELLTGEVPFVADTAQKVVRAQVKELPRPIREVRPDLSLRLAELVHEMLAKDPLGRPPSMEAVAFRLRAARDAVNAPDGRAKYTALVVDDDAALAKLLGVMVRSAVPDAHVTVVEDPEKALVALREHPPDVMFLDLHMPRMNGIELCMMLRGMHLADQCTIVAVSAGARDADIELLRQLGITRFLPKGADLAVNVAAQLKELHHTWLRSAGAPKRPPSAMPPQAPLSRGSLVPRPAPPTLLPASPAVVRSTRLPPAREVETSRLWLQRDEARSRLFGLLLDLTAQGVIVVDADGEPQTWNATADRLLGRALTRVPGESWAARPGVWDETGELPLAREQRPIVRALGGEKVDDERLVIEAAEEGERVAITMSARPVRDDDGGIAGALVVFRRG